MVKNSLILSQYVFLEVVNVNNSRMTYLKFKTCIFCSEALPFF